MSLPNYLHRLREKIAVWMKRHFRLRQRQLKVVRLEDRRLPDASFAMVGDALTMEAFDGATEAVDVSFDANTNEYHLELSSGTWLSENPGPLDPAVSLNGNVLTVALPSLIELQIHGSGTPLHVTDSGNAFSVGRLTITGATDVVMDSANDFDSISIEADSLTLNDSDDLEISRLQVADSVDLSVAGSLTNSTAAQIEVGGHASFEGSSIVLGQDVADHVELNSFSVNATESVEIVGDSALELTGSSTAAQMSLSSAESIEVADDATLTVEGNTALTADEINVRGEFHSASVTFHSAGHVQIHEASEMTLSGNSSAGSLTLEADGLLTDTANSLLQVTGHANLNADSITLGNGDVEIGSLKFQSAGTVTLLQESEIRLSGDSYAGNLVAENAELIGTGIIHNGIEISDGGVLGGWLNVAGALTIGPNGVLSPGNSPGITTSGNLTLAANSTLLIELDDDNSSGHPGAVAGVDYDQTQVTGTVTTNATATLNLQDLGSTQSLTGDVYIIVQNDGVDAVVGTFAGLANGAVVTAVAGGTYSIYYNGGTGNDIVLVRRPAAVTDVYVSNTFVGLSNGTSVTDYDFLTAGNQAGVYGLNAFATIPEAITAVTAGGIIHVDQGTFLHSSTLAVNKTVTIDGQGMGLTNILKAGAPTGNFDEAIRITADEVILSDAKLGWQIHNTTDYQGYVVITTADFTSINRILFGSNATGEGYRSAVVFEGSGANGADGLEISDSIFEGRWGRAAIRDGDSGSGQNFLITRNEFREDHFRWGPIAIGPQDSTGTPNNFAFSGEISFNYFGNGLDTLDFQSLGNQNYTVTITNQGLTAAGLDIVHNTFDWNDSAETNANGVYAQPAGVYITPSLTLNTNQILIQDNIFNNFAYAGPQPGSTDPLWRPTGGVFGGALEFDGADDFGVWQSSLFDVGTAGTLNFWVQMHDTSRRNQFFEGPGNAGFEMQYRNTSGGQVYGRTTTVGGDVVIRSGPDGATLLNTWHNIQYTWDFNATNATGRMRIYIDGVESGYLTNFTPNDLTWASAVSTVNGLMNIGRDPGDTTRYFDGLMDDVGWFNSVLDSTDRANIRTNGVAALASDARLVSHWDFNQSSGNIAVDNKNGIQLYLSTTGVVPTEFGAVFRPGQGQFGGALEFDGVDDFATFRSSDFNVGERGTLNFWVRMHDTSRRNQFFEGPDNAGMEFQFRNNSSGQLYGRTTTAGGDFVIRSGPDGATLLNTWRNIQYTWDFNATNAVGKMRIYVDGVESGYLAGLTPNDLTWTAITDTVNGLMNVGRDPGDPARFFDGLLDDIAWYDQVLSAGDRNSIRTSGVTAHNDLVAHWNLDDAIGTTQAAGNSGTNITLYVNQIAPSPPVSGYGVVTPLAALVLNNVFYNDVAGTYADSNQVLDSSNITGPTANPFFTGDDPHTVFTGTNLAEFYRLRFGSSAAYQSTEFQASIATLIPHVGANQENPVAVGTEDILVAGTDFDDLVVITFTSDNDGSFVFTRNVTGGTPDYVGTFNFIDITSFTFDGYGADDVMIVIQPTATQGGLYSLSKGITFHGDLQNSDGNALDSDGVTGGDTLVLLTSANDQAIIDSVSYVLGNDDPTVRHQGTITVADGLLSTTITYTGTEPIRDELIVDARTFSFGSTIGGGNETINVSAVGDTVAMAAVIPTRPAVSSRTLNNRIVSSLGPNISFANPRTQLTLNAGIGSDTININSLHTDYRAALTINGDAGTDAVNLNSSLTLGNAVTGNTGNLTATSETVTVANGVAINTTAESSGDGDIRFTSTGTVTIGGGASLTTSSGFVIVTTIDGDIDVDGTISTGSDNILLMANGTGRDVEVTADVSSSSGHLTVMAEDSVRLLANVDFQVGNAGTLIIEATNGTITMDSTAALTSANGGIRLLAVNDIALGDVTASNSHVSITSSAGSILDAESNDNEVDVVALGLRLQAALGIGTLGGSSNAIETTITTLSARAGSGGINILESNGLNVDDVTVTTQKVQTNNSLTATTDAVQSDLVTTNAGSIVLRSTNGTMTLNDGTGSANGITVSANGAGNVLLQTISGAADIVVNGNVETGIGHVSLFSSDDIDLNANISTGAAGTVHLAAGNIGNDTLTGIDMQNGTSITTAGGNVRLTADRESDVRLGLINAGRGHVSVLAERSVLDNNVAALNVQANAARIFADAALSNASNQVGVIGGSETGNLDPHGNNNAIDIQVTTLAAQSATGIYVKEADGLSVDATPQIVVQSVNADASLTAQTDNTLSDLVTTNNGPIKLQTTVGSLTLNDGDADSLVVSANGSGDVLLQTLGFSGDVLINFAISSVTGNITVNSADDIVVNGAITTGGTGTIYLVATNGATDAIGSQVDGIVLNFALTSNSGDVLLSSQNDLQQSALISSTSGDIGIIAARNIDQAVNGDVTTTSGDVLVQATAGSWTMDADASITAGGGDVLGTAAINIALGVISTTNGTANRIALHAVAGSITDANAASINVEETVAAATTSLSLRAGTIIGGASGTTSSVNNQALDIDVDTVAANAAIGIYLREVAAGGAITVDSTSAVTVNINGVVRADFRSSTTSAAETRTIAALEDLATSSNGPVKLVAENGTITLNGGSDVIGVSAHGTGGVLLEARGSSSDLIIDSTVSSDSGHVTLDGDRNVDINAAVTVSSGSGTVYVLSGADTDVDAQVSSANGDVLFEAGDELRQTALIRSTAGDIGIIAANSLTQAVNGDITTTTGDVFVEAGTQWSMNADSTITVGGGDVLGRAGTNITLGVISTTNATANRIALNAVTGSITDANSASINVEETVAGATTSLSLRAGTIIGGAGGTASSVNNQALDINVDNIAANAATGIYLREVAAGGAITVDTASAVTVSINGVVRADFDSSTTSVAEARTIASLEDLTTSSNGPIKLVVENGTITINGGTNSAAVNANGTGDVLFEARGSNSDLVVDGTVTSGSGHITLDADRSIDINATITVSSGNGTIYGLAGADIDVDAQVSSANGDILFEAGDEFRQTALIRSTAGDIGIIAANSVTQAVNGDVTTTTGDVLVQATAGNWTMNGGATITVGGGDVLGSAGNNITLGVISATNAASNRIALNAVAGSITDANSASINVEETVAGATTSLTLRAGTIIGGAGGTASSVNNQALDLNVDTVAANAATGIYLREVAAGGAIKVDLASAVTVNINDVVRADFDSSTTSIARTRTIAALEDLTSTINGPIKLVAENGTITINGGADSAAINANGTGDILLEARGSSSDLVVDGTVTSGSGHITLNADRHIDINATITVSSGNGTIYGLAGADIDVDAQVSSANGDILFEAGDELRQTVLIRSTAGDIGIIAANSVTQAVNGDVTTTTGDVLVQATAGNWTMNGGATITAGGGDVLGTAGNSITLGVISATNAASNRIALNAGAGSITDANSASINVEEAVAGATTSLSLRAGTIIGGASGTTSSINNQALDINVDTVAANAATGIYLREVAAGGAITVDTASAVIVSINDVVRADFDSSTTSVAESRTIAVLDDLTTSNGPIKLVAENGTITINRGSTTLGSDTTGVSSGNTGDILLEARGSNSDLLINTSVSSSSGNVTLDADHHIKIDSSATITVSSGNGTIYGLAGADIDVDAQVNSANGDILFEAGNDFSQTALIRSTAGDIGIIGIRNVDQSATGDITTTTGDVLVQATAGNWTMNGGAAITAGGGDVLGTAGNSIILGMISTTNATANRIALNAAAGSITDANVAAINVEETIAAATTSLSLRAGTIIGGAGGTTSAVNNQALDIDVDTVAANAATGIYLREIAVGGAIAVDTASAVTVSINGVVRADFDSSTTSVAEARTIASLEDLTTSSNGPIKLVVENGTITINGGTNSAAVNANGTGDVLFEARGANSDLIVNGTMTSGSGHLTLDADRNIDINAAISVNNGNGTIYVLSGTDTDVDAQVTSANGDILFEAGDEFRQTALIRSTAGDIGVIAANSVTQAVNGDVTTTTGDVLVQATTGNWTMNGEATITAGGGDILGTAGNSITLGVISTTNATANRIALNAGTGSITDANSASINVEETVAGATTSLSLRAGTIIGGASGTSSAVNNQALDIDVDTVAANAATGIYLREIAAGGAITVDTASAVTVSINGVVRADFDSSTTSVAETRTIASLEDLTSTNSGPIKLVAENGTITINGGANSAAINANGTGDILLEARGSSSDLVLDGTVASGSGHITLDADRHIDINATVTVSSGSGTVYVLSGADTDVDAQVSSANGDVLFEAGDELRQTALIRSTAGDIGIITASSLTQAVNGDITTTTGDVFVEAGTQWTMNADSNITVGGGDVLGRAGTNITLGVISTTNATANRIALNAVTGSITDANSASINVEETVAGATTSLSLRAGTIIGGASGTSSAVNNQALDINVDTVAASAATGIYLREIAAGGTITVDTASAVTVSINGVVRADFDSNTTSVAETRTIASLEDLTSTNSGPIKLVAENGTITINGGANSAAINANGTGDILLEARGSNSDLVVEGTVTSGSGHITLDADRHIDINATITVNSGNGTIYGLAGADTDVDAQVSSANGDILFEAGDELRQTALIRSTAGDIGIIAANSVTQAVNGDVTTTTGDVLVQATAGNWTMNGGATITAGGGDVLGSAGNNITLGVISATNAASNRIALNAVTGSITDANSASINVEETVAGATTSLSLRAGTIIGGAGGTTSSSNNQALDINVDNIAANAATGIYLREAAAGGAITVDTASAVTVSINGVVRADFDSSTTSVAETRTIASLEDLTSTNSGPIKLVAENGTITINGGANSAAINANGIGDILLEARGTGNDLFINGSVESGSGHVTLNATDDVELNASLRTGAAGTIYIRGAGVTVNAIVDSVNGDVLMSSTQEITQNAGITSSSGDVGLIADLFISQASTGDISTASGDVLIEAGTDWEMSGGTVVTAGGGDFDGKALAGDIALGQINSTRTALSAGSNISDVNGTTLNVIGTSVSLRAGGLIGNHQNGNGTSQVNANAIDTQVTTLAASAGTGIYIEEANSLTINTVAAVSVSVDNPRQANFDSATTDVSQARSTAVLEDLTTTDNGPIKIVSLNGSLTINGGSSAASGLTANGTGDVLLEARGTGSDVTLNADISSNAGDVTVIAADSVAIHRDLMTSGTGTVYVQAQAGSITLTDGDSNSTGIQTASGDILLQAASNITLNAELESTAADIGVDAGADLLQNRDITAGADLLLIAGQNITMAGSTVSKADGGELLLNAGANISLGLVQATNVAIESGASILDARLDETTNIRATNLRMIAGDEIGAADAVSSADTNLHAIDTEVTNLSAQSVAGIHIQEVAAGGSIIVRDVANITASVSAARANFNSTQTTVARTNTLSGLADLTTTQNGDIKLVAKNGSITISDGTTAVANAANGRGVQAHESGDVLLEARGTASDILVNSSILSGRGHITLNSADQIDLNASVKTSGNGTVYIVAGNNIDLTADVTTTSGDILVNAGRDLTQTDSIQSTAGDIGLIAGRNVLQSASGDTSTATGNVLVDAGMNWEMDGDATITVGGGKVLGQTQSGRILLGVIELTNATANQVALSAGTDLVDANAAAINIYESTASSATSVSLRSGGAIGNADPSNPSPGQNFSALDLNVDVVSASAVAGIYLREVAAGGGLTVSNIETVRVSIDGVQRSRFNSSSTNARQDREIDALEDLVTSNGPIKTVAENGTITIGGGNDSQAVSAGGSGDILVEARGAGSDVVVNGTISNGSGHITLNATDDVDLNASLSTGGSGTVYMTGAGISIDGAVTTENGDVLISSTQDISQTAAINSTTGDVGLIASLAVLQSSSGDITTISGDILIEAGTNLTMSNGTVLNAGGGDFDGKALAGDIALGRINSERTALTASSDISDANSTALNVVGTSLSLRAGGLVGNNDALNGTPLSNTNAIDTQISTLAALAGTGIYIEEANGLTVDSVADVNVSVDGPVRSNFKSTTTEVSQSRATAMLEDLTTTSNGPIKIVTLNGTITVNGGTSAGLAVSANGTGDVLLEARGTGSDVILNSDVMSATGHISIVAADSISIAQDIITGGAGRVLVEATGGSITLTDADANISGIKTTSGDVLLRAGQNVILTADLESTSATIGINAGIDLQQNRNITAGSDVLLVSGQNISMAATTETKADGGEMILAAVRNISLGLLQATNVSLNAGGSIGDARVAESTNIRATNLRMIAGDAIGDEDSTSNSGMNLNAIDTEVTNLAARSGTGIHLREAGSGGSVVVRDIDAVSVNVASGRVNFNSTLTDVLQTQRLSGLSDLTTTRNGDIKLLAENGTIRIEDGSNGVSQSSNNVGVHANGTGDVLLEARGNGSDLVVNSDIKSGSGHITLNSADDVNLTADLATSGSGTVYLRSLNNATDVATGIVMANGTSIKTGGGNVRLVAGNESDIRLGLINAGTGDVSLNAERSILDNNGSALNVQADALRIVADAAVTGAGSIVSLTGNGVGIIGGPDAINGTPSTNVNALDLQVATLAAQSADGIYLHEMDGVTIQSTGTIAVQQANFNSSTTTRTDSALSDLVTTDNGSIKLLSTEGTITVSDGDGDNVGVVADGSGDVLLQTQDAAGDIIVDASVLGTTGHLTLNAADDVDVNASISTGGAATVYVSAAGISIDATVTTVNGVILMSSTQNISQTALVTSSSGNIGLIATGTISQFNDGDITTTSGDVLVEAGRDWTMSTGTVIRAGGGDFDGKALNGSIALGQIRSTRSAFTAGNNISDSNGTALNVIGASVTFRAGGQIGNSDPSNGATLTNLNAIDTQVETLAALAGTGIYIEDADSLTIDSVAAVNVVVGGPSRANFNSTTTPVPQSRGTAILEDLTMTGVGEIRITTVSDSITLNRGTANMGSPLQNIAVYAPGGGKVSIQAATDIFVHGNIVTREEGVISSDPATDAIRLIARSGDIVIGDPSDLTREIVISTDHDEVNGSSDTTNDVVELIARAGQVGNTAIGGKISIQAPVTIRTDGGVAKKFGPRPDVGVASTAFFQYVSNPLPLAIDNSPAAWSTGNAYINAFSVLIGQSGEENLTVDIDWQDPSEEPGVFFSGTTQTIAGNMGIYNQISSERIQQFLVEKGGPSAPGMGNNTNGQIVVGHLYTALDYTRFQQQQNRTTIIIDLSVSHHSSINLSASSIAQSGVTQRVPGLDAASTDISTTVSDQGSATPDIFENGIASFRIPTVTPAPPAFFTNTFVPRADRPFSVAPPENQSTSSSQSTAEFGSGATGGSVFSTEVYFQIRRQYETDRPAEVVVERIADSSLISSREAFEKFVEQNPELQDGAGYEIWLISETGGQKVERPIVEFEISGGQPGTMHESVPEGSSTQQLKDLPFEQPPESEEIPEKQDSEIPQASMDADAAASELANFQPIADSENTDLATSGSTLSEQDTSTPISDVMHPSSAAMVGLMVRRFRKRQQESATPQSTFSRAARFQRRNSSPSPEFEVRGSSDV